MRWLLVVLCVFGCGSKAKPKPAAAEQEVTGVASIAGDWVADDEMSWSYALSIQANGALVGKIDRGKLPRCDREGKLAAGDAPRKFKLDMTKNTCEQSEAHPGKAELEVTSFTGNALTITVTPAGGEAEHRTYTRRP
jgi:hypothetical protein